MGKAIGKLRNHSFILEMKEAHQCGNTQFTVRKYKIYPCQIRRWA